MPRDVYGISLYGFVHSLSETIRLCTLSELLSVSRAIPNINRTRNLEMKEN